MRADAAARLSLFARTAIACLAIALSFAGATTASASFETGLGAGQYLSADPSVRASWFDRTVALRPSVAEIGVSWEGIATAKPQHPADPADGAYNFAHLDAAVAEAARRGLRILLRFGGVPDYAQAGGGQREEDIAWKPKPRALGRFVRAVAARYSGRFGGLPRVRHYDVWPESNLESHLAPQFVDGRFAAVARYRRMVNAAAAAVHGVDRRNRVVVGSLAPYGDPPGSTRTRPVTFLRRLFCLNRRLESTNCPDKTHVDVLAHHPINQSGPPRQHAINPFDASSADLGRIRRVLRAAEREGTIAGKRRRHPLWVTEFWWSDNLSDGTRVSVRKQARWTAESLYLFWKAGAQLAVYFPLVDSAEFPAGLFHGDGSSKPAAAAFAFPFVTRSSGKGLVAWGKAPLAGRLQIERRGAVGWHTVSAFRVKAGEVFDRRLAVSAPARLRARVGGEQSLPWRQR